MAPNGMIDASLAGVCAAFAGICAKFALSPDSPDFLVRNLDPFLPTVYVIQFNLIGKFFSN